jgi:hypothetical protein
VSVTFNCPKCKQKLTLTASKPGDWIDCPACEATVQVPGGAPPKPTQAQAAPAPAAPRYTPPAPADEPAAGPNKKLLVGMIAAAAALLLVGTALAVVALRKPKEPEQANNTAPPPATPQAAPAPAPAVTPAPVTPPVAPPAVTPPPKPPGPPEKPKPEVANVELTQTKLRTLKLGVNAAAYDNVGAILDSLGKGYAHTKLSNLDLEDAEKLKQFDVVFLNCGGAVGRQDLTQKALRAYVAAGKTLYASDLQYPLIAATFPEAADPKRLSGGTSGTYRADVLDEGLKELLGKTVDLTFNLDGWQAAAFGGEGVTTILQSSEGGRLKKGTPLLVKFVHEQGTVFFTAFHNSAIAGDTAKKILRHLVFSAVLADAEGRVLKVLKREDFTVKTPDLLTATDADWSVTRKHVQAKDGGLFRVGVGFNNEGAEVKLVLEGPDGVKLEKEGKDAFIAEVRYATAGEWKLTVTTNKLPYPNFPISLVVAEPK